MKKLRIFTILAVLLALMPTAAWGQSESPVTDIVVSDNFVLDGSILAQYPQLEQIDFVSSKPSTLTVTADASTVSFTFSGDWTMGSDLTAAGVRVLSGSFNTAAYRITSDVFFVGEGYDSVEPLTVTLSNSVINAPWFTVYRGLSNLVLDTKGTTINTAHFFGGGRTYDAVNLVGGGSYNVEDDNKIATLTADGATSKTLYVRGTVTVKTPPTITGTVDIVKAADRTKSRLPVGDQPKLSDPKYKQGAIVIGDVALSTKAGLFARGLGDWVYSSLVSTAYAIVGPAEAWWVGGTGNWSDATNHWSVLGSGGAPGVGNLPGTGTLVHFDANSFPGAGQVVTVDVEVEMGGMDWTGVTNTPTLADDGNNAHFLGWYAGNVTFVPGIVATFSKSLLAYGAATPRTLATGGLSLNTPFTSDTGFTGTISLGDNVNLNTATVIWQRGTLNTNGKTLTCGNFSASTAQVKTITNTGGTINTIRWDYDGSNLTLTAPSGIINVYAGPGHFYGGGLTYETVNLQHTSGTITGSNTFTTLALTSGTTQTITFTDGSTQTATTFTLSGSSGHIHTLQGSGAAGWNLSKAAGTVNADYISISRSTAAGGATFNANGASVNGGNNVGWNFPLTVSTQAASAVSMDKDGVTSGTFNGTLTDMGGANDTVWFEYGLTAPAYGSTTAAVAKTAPAAFTAAIPAGLTPGATYHFRAKMDNGTTTAVGADQSFTLTMPTVTTSAVSGQSLSGLDGTVTLNGNVTNLGSSTGTYTHFEWGPTVAYGTVTPTVTNLAIGSLTATFTFHIVPNVVYHYRSVAVVGGVTTTGADQTFVFSGGGAAGYALLQNVLTLIMAAGILIAALKFSEGDLRVMAVMVSVGLAGIVIIRGLLF